MNTIKDAKNTVIQGITTKVEKAMSENNGKVPYGFVAREVATAKVVFPNLKINRDHINYMLDKCKKERSTAIQQTVPLNDPIVTLPTVPKILGRPTGSSTEKRKRSKCLNVTAAKNGICELYSEGKELHNAKHAGYAKTPNFFTGRLGTIINEVKKKR